MSESRGRVGHRVAAPLSANDQAALRTKVNVGTPDEVAELILAERERVGSATTTSPSSAGQVSTAAFRERRWLFLRRRSFRRCDPHKAGVHPPDKQAL